MGFFQDLKEDLSLAVNELIPDEDAAEKEGRQQESEEDISLNDTIKEVEAALTEEFEADAASEGACVETDDEDAETDDEAGEEPVDEVGDDAVEEAASDVSASEAEEKKEPVSADPEDTNPSSPIIDAAAAQIASIDNIVAKEESGSEYEEREMQSPEELLSEDMMTDPEETELEKEVEMAMTERKVNLEMEEVADETAVITAAMTITGDISSRGSVEVLGKIKGTVEVLGKLNVSGTIEGDSKGAEIFADSAHITGKVTSEGTVKIGQNSVVIGDIVATSAVIAGAVKGDIDVQGPVVLDTSAIVMGNIKSKSVQINNGAVIEGMCSQCYAEVNPTSFFEELIQK